MFQSYIITSMPDDTLIYIGKNGALKINIQHKYGYAIILEYMDVGNDEESNFYWRDLT